jgi:hypothetical protein
MALCSRGEVPGVWIVLTGWDPELVPPPVAGPELNGHAGPAAVCGAVALALIAPRKEPSGPQLHFVADARHSNGTLAALFSVEALLAALTADAPPARPRWRLGCGGWVELEQVNVGAEIQS